MCVKTLSLGNPGIPGIQDFPIPKSRDWKIGPELETLYTRYVGRYPWFPYQQTIVNKFQ